jgi:hypothetical protein
MPGSSCTRTMVASAGACSSTAIEPIRPSWPSRRNARPASRRNSPPWKRAAPTPTLLEDLEYRLEDAIFAAEDAQAAVETGPADPFLDVLFLDASRGFAVGAYGMLFTTEDGGETWQPGYDRVENIDRFHFYAIHRADEAEVFLAGEAGLLYRSDDGGSLSSATRTSTRAACSAWCPSVTAPWPTGCAATCSATGLRCDDWELLPTPNTREPLRRRGDWVTAARCLPVPGACCCALRRMPHRYLPAPLAEAPCPRPWRRRRGRVAGGHGRPGALTGGEAMSVTESYTLDADDGKLRPALGRAIFAAAPAR